MGSPAAPRRTVLIVEDAEDQAFILSRAFQDADPDADPRTVGTLRDALAYLAGEPPFQDRGAHPLPELVVVDLHLPDGDGLEVVQRARSDPRLDAVPVVVLTVHGDARVQRAYRLGANSYVLKDAAEGFGRTARTLADYWMRVNGNAAGWD